MVLTVHKEEEYIFEALKAGTDGYLLKDATREELLLSVQSVIEGKTYISPGISEKLVSGYLKGKKPEIHSRVFRWRKRAEIQRNTSCPENTVRRNKREVGSKNI